MTGRMLSECADIGRILNFRGNYLQDWSADENGPLSWRFQKKIAGSGAVGDIGTHVVDLAHYLAAPIVAVNALTRTYVKTRPIQQGGVDKLGASEKSANAERAKVDVDDEVVSMLKFESGAIGLLKATRHRRRADPVAEILLGFRWRLHRPDPGLAVLDADHRCHRTALRRTGFGRRVLSTGGGETATRYSGIDTAGIKLKVFVLSSNAAAIAGMLCAGRLQSGRFHFGKGDELAVIAAAVLGRTSLFGGKGTVVGTIVGALMIGLINNGLILMGL